MSDASFGGCVSYLISQAFDRVETLDPDRKYRYHIECKLCGGTNALRDHYKNTIDLVIHGGACILAEHLPRLRALAAPEGTT